MVSREKLRKDFENATGEIRYGYTNNYMFIRLMEENQDVLKGLICSLLFMENSENVTVNVLNPINLSDIVEGKTYILDIEVLLNQESFVNLEMQVDDRGDYELRSVQYLCRAYDNLNRGDFYKQTRKAVHIGFLGYDLFQGDSEFYSRYLLKNIKTGKVYTDRFDLRIVNMNRIGSATEEDIQYGIRDWARIFKARTWEEMKTLVHKENNEIQADAAALLYNANLDDVKRRHAQAYEDFMQNERRRERERIEKIEVERKLAEKEAELAESRAETAEKETELIESKAEIARLKNMLKENGIIVSDVPTETGSILQK